MGTGFYVELREPAGRCQGTRHKGNNLRPKVPMRQSGADSSVAVKTPGDERKAGGREASPSAGVIDGQSAKSTEASGPRGYDAGKKALGRKWHILIESIGLLVGTLCTRPMYRIAMVRRSCRSCWTARFPGFVMSSPMAPVAVTNRGANSRNLASGPSRWRPSPRQLPMVAGCRNGQGMYRLAARTPERVP